MIDESILNLFKDEKIRSIWDDKTGDYYYSIVDLISIITESKNPDKYWSDLKRKMKKDEYNLLNKYIVQMEMPSSNGKMRLTDAGDIETVLRIIQAVPSPNAEPYKEWLAQVANEYLEEYINPELAIEMAIGAYRKKGYSEEWISRKLFSMEIRNGLKKEGFKEKTNREHVLDSLA